MSRHSLDPRSARSIAVLCVAGLGPVGLSGCLGSGDGGGGGGGGSKGPIKIGVLAEQQEFLAAVGSQAIKGAKFATAEINAGGGVNGRKLELLVEDIPDPGVGVQKATKLITRDRVDALTGVISSATGLAVADVANRSKKLYVNFGWNSNEGRTTKCNKYTFHVEGNNTMYVGAVASAFKKQFSGRGTKVYFITSDYAYGHDLLKVSRSFINQQGARVVGSSLAPTGTSDMSTYITEMRKAKPDVVWVNLAGGDITTFLKQYKGEFGDPFPVIGAGMDEVQAWSVGKNMTGTWPGTYYFTINTPGNKKFVQEVQSKQGQHPDNQFYQAYIAVKVMADAMKATKSTDSTKLADYLASGVKFDVMKQHPATFDKRNHQLVQDMYALRTLGNTKTPFKVTQTVPGQELSIPASQVKCNVGAP